MADTDRFAAYRASFRLDGKIAPVLGAASGIGRASAEAMAPLGTHVIGGSPIGTTPRMRIVDLRWRLPHTFHPGCGSAGSGWWT